MRYLPGLWFLSLPAAFFLIGLPADAKGRGIACSPDQAAVQTGMTVAVHAWVDPPPSSSLAFAWAASGGTISSQGSVASWDLAGLKPGAYVAAVRVVLPGDEALGCKAVVVIQSEAARGLLEARSFLINGKSEAPGYGLYTYLLLGSRPVTAQHRKLYARTLEAYLKLDDVLALEKYGQSRKTLNIAYLPLRELPPQEMMSLVSDTQYAKLAEWVLGRYNYERASVLLRRLDLGKIDPNGVYMVWSLAPLSTTKDTSAEVLYQDLSTTPPDYAWAHVRFILRLASQQGDWSGARLQKFALDTRFMMANLAQGFEDLRGKLEQIQGWAKLK